MSPLVSMLFQTIPKSFELLIEVFNILACFLFCNEIIHITHIVVRSTYVRMCAVVLYLLHFCGMCALLCVYFILPPPIPTLLLLPLPPLPLSLPPSTGPDGGGEAAIPKGEDRV